jgi:hypothetical protein
MIMKNGLGSLLIILLSTFCLNAQRLPVFINGSFREVPLKSFILEIEQKYPVKFFFDEKTISNISVTGTFHETPLNQCLETILLNKQVNFIVKPVSRDQSGRCDPKAYSNG